MAKKKINAKERREALKDQRSKKYLSNSDIKINNNNVANISHNKISNKNNLENKKLQIASNKEAFAATDFVAKIKVLSPLHLGSGEENVVIDAEIVHDELGLPYFPAKRFKGLLYESALEVAEMFELANVQLFTKSDIDQLFQHNYQSNDGVRLIIPNLYLSQYQDMRREWKSLQSNYPEYFQPADVLEQYTSIRYQTRIDREKGIAADTSLHNMRVLNAGITFSANIKVKNASALQMQIIALAFRNLSQAGVKRNRGFGNIECLMEWKNKDIRTTLVNSALREGGLMK